jgi:hypothetical protein
MHLNKRFLQGWIPIVVFLGFSKTGFAQNDTLRNQWSSSIELQKYPNFNAYLASVEWLHRQKQRSTILKLYQGARHDKIGRGVQIEVYPKFKAGNYGYLSLSASDRVLFSCGDCRRTLDAPFKTWF